MFFFLNQKAIQNFSYNSNYNLLQCLHITKINLSLFSTVYFHNAHKICTKFIFFLKNLIKNIGHFLKNGFALKKQLLILT